MMSGEKQIMNSPVRLILLRHGEAERLAARDELRQLTSRGREEARSVATQMRTLGLQPTAVYSSPYIRARETAEIVADVLQAGSVRQLAGVTPDDDPRRALATLDALVSQDALPMVVTHMPFIGALAGMLVDGSSTATTGFVTAGGVLLAGDMFAPGLLQVVHQLHP